jgi:hypothetical protein
MALNPFLGHRIVMSRFAECRYADKMTCKNNPVKIKSLVEIALGKRPRKLSFANRQW